MTARIAWAAFAVLIAAAAAVLPARAEELIRKGRVTVNGETASIGDSADPTRDIVAVDGETVHREMLAYWMLNKPRGVITTASDPEGRRPEFPG